jgi:hypothetical protein
MIAEGRVTLIETGETHSLAHPQTSGQGSIPGSFIEPDELVNIPGFRFFIKKIQVFIKRII